MVVVVVVVIVVVVVVVVRGRRSSSINLREFCLQYESHLGDLRGGVGAWIRVGLPRRTLKAKQSTGSTFSVWKVEVWKPSLFTIYGVASRKEIVIFKI